MQKETHRCVITICKVSGKRALIDTKRGMSHSAGDLGAKAEEEGTARPSGCRIRECGWREHGTKWRKGGSQSQV